MNSPMNFIDPNGMYPDSWQRPGETAVAYSIRMNSPELYNMMYSDGGGGAGGLSWNYVVNSVLSGNFSNINAGHYTSDGSYYSLDQITINAISKNGWTLNNPGSNHFNKWFDHYEVEITSVSASVDGGRDWQSDAISQTNGMLLTTDKLFNGAGYAAGAVGAIQIGMLEYRMSLPLPAKTGSFSQFSAAYKGLGYTSRTLGRIRYTGAGVGFIMDINAVRTGEISIGRFGYRTGSIGTAIASKAFKIPGLLPKILCKP